MKIYKKNLLALCGLALALGACSNEELPGPNPGDVKGREVTIKLNLGVEGHMELFGRGEGEDEGESEQKHEPRQMLNQRAQQCVNDVRIYIFRSRTRNGDYLYMGGGDQDDGSFLVSNKEEGVFYNVTPWEGDGDETHNFEIKPRLEDGYYYKFLAVGRDDFGVDEINPDIWDSKYPWWFGYKTLEDCNFIEDVTKFDEAYIEVKRNTVKGELYEPNYVTEIFSGFLTTDHNGKPIYVTENTSNFIGTIYLTRAVAGLYALITNIPCKVIDDETGLPFKPDEVNLLLSVCATKTNLVYKTDASDEHFNDVIVGQVVFRYTTVFNGNKWTDNGEMFLRQGTNYKGMDIPDNTSLMSNFIMPVDIPLTDDTCEATLVLQYYTALNNGHLIRSQKLNCSIVAVDPNADNVGAVPENKGSKFAIEANKLYVLCSDYDINKPIDLSKFTRLPNGNSGGTNPGTNPENPGENQENTGDNQDTPTKQKI